LKKLLPLHDLVPCLAVLFLGAAVLALTGCGRRVDDADSPGNRRAAYSGRAGGSGWSSALPLAGRDLESPEARLCRRFMDLKNAGDPQADGLLGPPPAVPADAVAPAEADRLEAELMLRQPLHIREVGRDAADPAAAGRFVLVVDGAVTSDRVLVATPTGPESRQRAMWSPDLVVEVRDGKIYGVRPQLHEG
jgi:hypothetical protein